MSPDRRMLLRYPDRKPYKLREPRLKRLDNMSGNMLQQI